MNRKPAPVTKAYAIGLVAAVIIFVSAVLIAAWGLISLFTEKQPVAGQVSVFAAPTLVALNLIILGVILWRQVLSLLRANRPAWSLAIILPGVAYLVWALGGTAFGMQISETWLSPFALIIALTWAMGLGIFWALLLRKLYGANRGVPRWPWEDRDDRERRGEID